MSNLIAFLIEFNYFVDTVVGSIYRSVNCSVAFLKSVEYSYTTKRLMIFIHQYVSFRFFLLIN